MKRILIIEDQTHLRENFAMILELEGFQVVSAANGKEGVDRALSDPPDLVLCDVNMPVMDGYGVVSALRANASTSAIPFIFLTARSEKSDIRSGMNQGADDYLTKPVTRGDLIEAVRSRLHRHEAVIRSAPSAGFHPDFSSTQPLEERGLTPREAEVLLWAAQGKSNAEISGILGAAEATVKKHMTRVMEKLGVENRNAATVVALEVLCKKH